MKPSTFIGKFMSRYLWGNIAAMALALVVGVCGVKWGLDIYTHHGESIAVPDVKGKAFADAQHILEQMGFEVQVSDTGYVKSLSPDCVLEQNPEPGTRMKSGRTVSLIVNAAHSPTLAMPDLVDNSSLREATAKLKAMGFKVGEPQYVSGEKDWVYGIVVRGHQVATGQRVSIEDIVVIQAGSGLRDERDSVQYIDADDFEPVQSGDVDDFEEVDAPPELGEEKLNPGKE